MAHIITIKELATYLKLHQITITKLAKKGSISSMGVST